MVANACSLHCFDLVAAGLTRALRTRRESAGIAADSRRRRKSSTVYMARICAIAAGDIENIRRSG